MFDELRASLRDVLGARLAPEDRRAVLAAMRDGLVHARLSIDDLKAGVRTARTALAAEERELATVVRRQGLATEVGDLETVAIAERFAREHGERVALLRDKVAVAEREVALAEREYEAMMADYRRAMSGLPPATAAGSGGGSPTPGAVDDTLDPVDGAALDALTRERDRATREAAIDERLAALKARLGRG
jgi:hypothetical protein